MDFDADKESDRQAIYEILQKQILDDLLLNVLFGRLSAMDISLFLDGIGIPGLLLAALECIAAKGFVNMPGLARDMNGSINPSTVRPRVQHLMVAGMLHTMQRVQMYMTTQRARVFLKLCQLINDNKRSPELDYILNRLDISTPSSWDAANRDEFPRNDPACRGRILKEEIIAAHSNFGVSISGGPYIEDPSDIHGSVPGSPPWIGR